MNSERFTECCFLRLIGRDLLTAFLTCFTAELATKGLNLPAPEVSDEEFYRMLPRMLMSPGGLPVRLDEVLHEVQELSTAEGSVRLEAAVADLGLPLSLNKESTREEIALRVWLLAPDLVTQKYNEQKFTRLRAFQYCERNRECLDFNGSGSEHDNLSELIGRLDAWFSKNGRGDETVVIEKYRVLGEDYYLVRHGERFLRSLKVENRSIEVMHYRPAKDDLVVYSPERDQLRINAKTKGERELYRKAFGEHLRGFADYFRVVDDCTLNPLREGPEALECHDIPGLDKIVLTELKTELREDQFATFEAEDVFASAWGTNTQPGLMLPAEATLKEAAFKVYIQGSERPLQVRIKPPHTIRLGKDGALQPVHDWLSARGFRQGKVKTAA